MKNKSTVKNTLFPSSLRLDLTSNDPEQMDGQSAFWGIEHKQFGRGLFSGHIQAVHTGRIQMSLARRTPGVLIRGGLPPKTAIISLPLSSFHPLHYRGASLKPGQLIALTQGEEIDLYTSLPSSLLTIAISRDFLDSQCSAVTGKAFDQIRCQEKLSIYPEKYEKCTRTLIALLQRIHSSSVILNSSDEEYLEEKILNTILDCVVPAAPHKKPPERINLAQKAGDYILNNLKNPICINDLNKIAGVSERSLHRSFKELFGVSPKAYLQIMRLNGVRKDLSKRGGAISISDTAMNWGFFHLSRFAQQYRRMFAESPSTTLRRSKNDK